MIRSSLLLLAAATTLGACAPNPLALYDTSYHPSYVTFQPGDIDASIGSTYRFESNADQATQPGRLGTSLHLRTAVSSRVALGLGHWFTIPVSSDELYRAELSADFVLKISSSDTSGFLMDARLAILYNYDSRGEMNIDGVSMMAHYGIDIVRSDQIRLLLAWNYGFAWHDAGWAFTNPGYEAVSEAGFIIGGTMHLRYDLLERLGCAVDVSGDIPISARRTYHGHSESMPTRGSISTALKLTYSF